MQTYTHSGCFVVVCQLAPLFVGSWWHSELWRYWMLHCAGCAPRHKPQSLDLEKKTQKRKQIKTMSKGLTHKTENILIVCHYKVTAPGFTSMLFNSFFSSSLVFWACDRMRYISYPIITTPPSLCHLCRALSRSWGCFTVASCVTCNIQCAFEQ